MGEARRKRRATERLIAEYPSCAFCGEVHPATTREHMPPKALFDGSHRPDKLVMPACKECNGGTSTSDLIASIVSRWNYSAKGNELSDHSRLAARVRIHHPEIMKEWTSLKATDRVTARNHLIRHGVPVPTDAGMVSIGPLTIRQLNLFSHKVALGLYFEHFKSAVPATGLVAAYWRTKEDFARGGIPAELLKIMQQYGTLEQGKWNARETFEYKFETNQKDGLFACLARLRGNFFVTGFAVRDASLIENEDIDWIRPPDLLGMLDDPRFIKRL
jgi:hypothetical protein